MALRAIECIEYQEFERIVIVKLIWLLDKPVFLERVTAALRQENPCGTRSQTEKVSKGGFLARRISDVAGVSESNALGKGQINKQSNRQVTSL